MPPDDSMGPAPDGLAARLRIMAAETRECTVCDGNGVKASGNECGGCGGSGRVPVLWGLANKTIAEAADRITTLERELVEARRHVELLQNKINGPRECACAYDSPNDICALHSPQLAASQAEVERLKEALAGLVEKLDVVHGDSRYESVWAIAQLHGGVPYSGPTYTAELATARAAITRQGETG